MTQAGEEIRVPFDIEKAKQGRKVMTRGGLPVRIICYDAKKDTPVIALITCPNDHEVVIVCYTNGKLRGDCNSNFDLFMVPEKHEEWINVYRTTDGEICCSQSFPSKSEAKNNRGYEHVYINTVKIREWVE